LPEFSGFMNLADGFLAAFLKTGHRLFQALPYCENRVVKTALLWNLYCLAGVLTPCRKDMKRQGAAAAKSRVPGAAHYPEEMNAQVPAYVLCWRRRAFR
jgi:hypothetical protein